MTVDDEPAATQLTRIVLEQTGCYTVLEVNEPRAASAAAREFLPDLVLMDVSMPGMDGRAVACLIQSEPGLANVPILFVTSRIDEESHASNNPFGWKGVLTKPVSAERLILAAADIFRSKKLRAFCP